MRTLHEGSSWQAPWQRREGSIKALRFNTSSKSRKNWNCKQSRTQCSIHCFITLGKVGVMNTLSHIWVPEAPVKLHNLHPHKSATKPNHSTSSYHLTIPNALAFILHLLLNMMFKQRVNMPQKLKHRGAKARRQKDDKKSWWSKAKNPVTLQVCEASETSGSLLWSHVLPINQQSPRTYCRFSGCFRAYGKAKSTCDVLLLYNDKSTATLHGSEQSTKWQCLQPLSSSSSRQHKSQKNTCAKDN